MMHVTLLNPFIEAAAEVLRMETSAVVRRGKIRLCSAAHTVKEVSVVLSLVGQVRGLVIYGFSEEMALALVEKMMGAPVAELDELGQSGIAELGNVMTGRAATKLADKGFHTDISPPTLILGRGATVSTVDFPQLAVPLETQYGVLEMHLGVREAADGSPPRSRQQEPVLADARAEPQGMTDG